MKTTIQKIAILLSAALVFNACGKKNKDPEEPPPPANTEEVITTFKLMIKDSATNVTTNYSYVDQDGDGGIPAHFSGPNQSDSLFTLLNNKTYFVTIELLDETKSPVANISAEVGDESKDHMFFFNNGNNTVINSGNPYTVKLNGSNIEVKYLDLDNGSPQRGLGLQTRWRTAAATGAASFPVNIILKHQSDVKNGTFTPGETDVDVTFKVKVN